MALRAAIEPVTKERTAPGDVIVDVRIVNDGPDSQPFHEHQARHGSLVLQIEDEDGTPVPLPSPSPPGERDLAPPGVLGPGESLAFRYTGFLASRRKAGRYRVRWFSPHRELGAAADAPLASEWTVLDVVQTFGPPPGPPAGSFGRVVYEIVRGAWLWLKYYFDTVPRRLFCYAVLNQEVDLYIVETITDGFPAAWNNTFAWNARFHVQVDQPAQRVVVTIRLRVAGVNVGTGVAWAAAVSAAWGNRFKSCVSPRCGSDGFPIQVVLQYVASGEHHTLTLAPQRTEHMLRWGAADGDQGHEVGHMLGNKEEYFTVDGVPYGPGRQPGGNIMNNPDNPPVAAHYWLIQQAVGQLLGMTFSVRGGTVKRVDAPC